MPINKDLSVSPYFDDFNEGKNYHRVLFKPSVAVQVRELNQLQAILQHQVERFGNNIYKRGTIIDGCNFIYYPNYAYIKINDAQLDSEPATPSDYVGSFITDPSSNLTAHIINSVDGFETTDPNLKTLYVRYINSGNSGTATKFNAGSVLTIYDYLDSVNSVKITNGSSGWSNTDSVIFCSALQVDLSTNTTFTVGETVTQTGGAHVAIIDDIIIAKGKKVLKIRPRTTDLSNTAISSTIWKFDEGADIIGSSSGATATIGVVVGTGASATAVTSADVGKIVSVDILDGGSGYYVPPYVGIKSSGTASAIGTRDYNNLVLTAQNYVAQITVSNKANSVGYGYAFGITEGVIYQKGFFVGVDPQTVIVSKHSPSPNNVSVGFRTDEDIVDSNIDQDLLDNAIGESNEFAPGADRLKLTPTLVVSDTGTVEDDEEFLTLAEFSEGRPFVENRRTQFNSIMDEMALRTRESSGDFVIDQFLVTTRSPSNTAAEGKTFSVVVDPGRGYIDGYRVETTANYFVDADKGIDSISASKLSTSLDYGNYILVTQVGGVLNCNIGSTISLLSAATSWASNSTTVSTGSITPSGSVIGTARIRNMVFESGEPGTGTAIYRVYLFDIRMNAGQSFAAVKGAKVGISFVCDTVLTYDATTNTNICLLFDKQAGSSLVVSTGSSSTQNITNLNYVYRQTTETLSIANTGSASLLLTDPTETFGYETSSLTDLEKRSVILVPTSADIVFVANTTADGTAAITSGSNTITVTSASVNKYSVGDWLALYSGASTYILRRITNKAATTLQLDASASFTNAASTFARAFPRYTNVGLHRVPGATVVTTGGDKTLTINLANTIASTSSTTCALTYDVQVSSASPQSKTAKRDLYVKIGVANNTVNGPWCLGIPDIFRLKNVYLGANSSVNTSSTDVTDQFYIDHNQTADYYGLGYLFKKTASNITLSGTSYLLVKFDAFTSTPGVFTLNSYVSSNTAQRFADDSLPLSSLGTKANSFEIPEVYTAKGTYYDLLNCIDFRPVATSTAAYANTVAAATVNPSSTLSFSGSSKKFPLPESGVTFNRTSFLGRKDSVIVTKDNDVKVLRGAPSVHPAAPVAPNGVLYLNTINVPPYPGIADKFSSTMKTILDKKMANERFLLKRIKDHTITVAADATRTKIGQPRGYTMSDIGNLERRIKDLEYNVALSMVEDDLKDKVIPSVATPGLNRFKFGFFVDDYSTTNYSDTGHVEYRCDVVDSKVVPNSLSTGTPHGPDNPATGECLGEFEIVKQGLASSVSVVTTPNTSPNTAPNTSPNTAPNTAPTAVVVPKLIRLYKSNDNTGGVKVSTTGWLGFSSVPSPWRIDYDMRADDDLLTIQKRSANGAITTLYSNNLIHAGTLNFNHDPASGREYKVVVTRHSREWRYTMWYPIDSTIYVTPTAPSANVGTTLYDGALVSLRPGTFRTQSMYLTFGQTAYVSLGIVQNITMASLKPNTNHTVSIGDSTTSIVAQPILTTGTGSVSNTNVVTSDASGVVNFKMMIDNTVVDRIESLTGHTYQNQVPSTLYVTVASADNTSSGSFVVKIDTGIQTTTATGSTTLGTLSPVTLIKKSIRDF
jgi:hypothetical protein